MTPPTLRLTIVFCALCAFGSAPASADECSGGAGGGMGASGNDCSSPDSYAVSAPAQADAPVAEPTSAKAFSRPALERVAHPRSRPASRRTHATRAMSPLEQVSASEDKR